MMSQPSMRLLKVAGQSNDWSLVFVILQLAPTPQCEMRCLSKFALPAHNWVVLQTFFVKDTTSLACSLKGRRLCMRHAMLFVDFNRLVCLCNCACAGLYAHYPSAVPHDSFKMLTLVHDVLCIRTKPKRACKKIEQTWETGQGR